MTRLDATWSRLAMAALVALVAAGCAAARTPTVPPHAAGPSITIAFGGDVNLGRRQNAITARDGASAALGAIEELARADLAIVNLESVVASSGEVGVDKGERAAYYFRGRPEQLDILLEAGVDAVATANNHSGDYDTEALLEQAALLDAAGIAHAGSGRDVEGACAGTLLSAESATVALISADSTMPHFAADARRPGTCYLPLDDPEAWRQRLGPAIEAAGRAAHLVLVAVHWGPNGAAEPSAAKREIGRLLIALGADAVLGSSAHLLQGVEIVDGRPVIHDAGNLLFDSQEGAVDSAVFVLEATANGVREVRLVPVVSEYGFTRRADAVEHRRILETLGDRSARLGTAIDGDRVALAPPERDLPPDAGSPPEHIQTSTPPATEPPAGCLVAQVPEGHAIEPITFGKLTLLGATVDTARLTSGELVWVDSYWRVEEQSSDNLWLSPRIVTASGELAWRGDHEPCDWAWPTSRMVPGQIYHDQAALRPRGVPLDEPLSFAWTLTDGEHVVTPIVVVATLPPMDPEGRRAILALLTRVEAMARENIQRGTEYPKKL